MTINLSELKKSKPHRLKKVFKPFITSRIAELLDISPGYLCNVLNGHYKASNGLEKRMLSLAEDIRNAQGVECE
jgi:hypothetical protein